MIEDSDLPLLIAPKGKYRIIGIDKFHPPGTDHWLVGDYYDLETALKIARAKTEEAKPLATSSSIATVYYVYDDKGWYRGGNIYYNE
ncbi:MAG: hypothetical protein HY957_10890 [Nitrospirae bacterium]|nr:hypothetical protein [Nitrospirota bacterium]